jgi:hypothetical protein|tara:strand:+ start:238 stop:450 length:213 start_codon:yes stop_codon:yes gene_type:complete
LPFCYNEIVQEKREAQKWKNSKQTDGKPNGTENATGTQAQAHPTLAHLQRLKLLATFVKSKKEKNNGYQK